VGALRAMRVVNIVGARPNFVKIAPLIRAMTRRPAFEPTLIHTGQHYDQAMSERTDRRVAQRRAPMIARAR
jgi:UDP-N-acetylglucosamine 2-epimerase